MNQELRDARGLRIGEIRDEGDRQVICDACGQRLGYYDGRYTYDERGLMFAEGNLLTALLKEV